MSLLDWSAKKVEIFSGTSMAPSSDQELSEKLCLWWKCHFRTGLGIIFGHFFSWTDQQISSEKAITGSWEGENYEVIFLILSLVLLNFLGGG